MKLLDIAKISFSDITRKKIQTFLTSIGISIGVALIFILISVSRGLENTIKSQFEKIGGDTVIVTAGRTINVGISIFSLRGTRSFFSESLVNRLKNLDNVKYVLPIGRTIADLKYNGESTTIFSNIIPVVYSQNLENFGFSLNSGRFFSSKDAKQCSIIIGKAVQDFMFSSKLNIGDPVLVNGKRCIIVGILSSTGNLIIDYSIFMPYEYYKTYVNSNFSGFSQIYIKLKDYSIGYVDISRFLDREFGKEYSIITMETLYETISTTIKTISTFALLLSLISIIVSAIGVANTMFSSIIERKKEIGILKAIGMKNIHVLEIFLLESAIIGFFAGIFGIISGIIGANIFAYAYSIYGYSFKIYLGLDLFLLSFTIPVLVGIVSGFVPAYQASKIDPIEILKSE